MLATKLNVTLANGSVNVLRSRVIIGRWHFMNLREKSNFYTSKICVDNLSPSEGSSKPSITRYIPMVTSNSMFNVSKAGSVPSHPISWRNFSSEKLEEPADVFGDLGDKNYEKTDMDEYELKEEEFLMNEAKRPRRLVLSPGKRVEMIKKHIKAGDLKAAIGVLDQIKEDRTEFNDHMYNLIIRALGMQGDLKKCFSLYNQMKKRGLMPTSPTYVSLLNACANSSNSQLALEKLNYVRQLFIEKDIKLNPAHYNVMVKAFGRHGKIFEAFQLVDEMRDKKLTIGISTCNFLLQGSITDKKAGFRHALIVWHILRNRKLKPDIFTYNLLLRSARDCKLEKFNIRDLLVSTAPGEPVPRIVYSDRINLLAHPPVLGQSLPSISDSQKSEGVDPDMDSSESKELIAAKTPDSMLEPVIEDTDQVPDLNLESTTPETNLLLIGGFNNFVDQMKKDNVQPDIKTITFLMEVVPHTKLAEEAVIKYAKAMEVQLDIDFYNALIKKRSFKFDYDGALEVLNLIQRDNLEPNVMTWGVLALTCRKSSQVRELFEGMELTGQRTNLQIIGAIMRQGCLNCNFGIVLAMMEKLKREGLKPNSRIYEMLQLLRKKAYEVNKDKDSPDFVRETYWQNGYRKFNLRYPTWLKEMKDKPKNRKREIL